VIKFVNDFNTTGWWFSPDTPVSSTNKTDCHNITEILLKVSLSTNQPIYFQLQQTPVRLSSNNYLNWIKTKLMISDRFLTYTM
jgi:hypothetical protein